MSLVAETEGYFKLLGLNPFFTKIKTNPNWLSDLTIGKVYYKEIGKRGFICDDSELTKAHWSAFSWERVADQHEQETFAPLSGSKADTVIEDEVKVPGGTKYDNGKVMMGLLVADCACSIEDIAKVLSFGARKYAPRGWKAVEPYRYLDAMHRHLSAHYQGEKFDDESGLSHLSHAACNMIFLMEIERTGKCMFDRPI